MVASTSRCASRDDGRAMLNTGERDNKQNRRQQPTLPPKPTIDRVDSGKSRKAVPPRIKDITGKTDDGQSENPLPGRCRIWCLNMAAMRRSPVPTICATLPIAVRVPMSAADTRPNSVSSSTSNSARGGNW